MTPDIEFFTELGDFLATPVHTYSASMMMRLPFAVATSITPEISLIDEMFGVGDESFQKKATYRMEALIASAKIFIFASHSKELTRRCCTWLFVLEHGTLTETLV